MSFNSVIRYDYDQILAYREICTEKPPNYEEIEYIFKTFTTNPKQVNKINSKFISSPKHQRKASDPKSRRKFKIKGTWESNNSATTSAKEADLYKNFVSLLNKITLDNYNDLSVKLAKLVKNNVRNVRIMDCISDIIFNRAISDFAYSNLYIDISEMLDKIIPSFPDENNQEATLGKFMISKCQLMFEKILIGKPDENPLFEKEELESRFKSKCIGSVTLIGKMFIKKRFPFKFLNECIINLLEHGETPRPDLLELASKLISIVGQILDEEPCPKDINGTERLDEYFEKVGKFSTDKSINSRIRFNLLDLIDLRKNKWVERKNQKAIVPKTIEEIRNDDAQEQLEKAKVLSRSNSPLIRRNRTHSFEGRSRSFKGS